MSLTSSFTRGIIRENPTFRLVLGMCPTLATTTSLENAIGMGAATTFVLTGSNIAISAIRRIVPSKVRIPCYVVVIASFVTIVDLLMQAYTPLLTEKLGIFIPLIVVNCIILGRAEAFACRNTVAHSAADGIGMGIGFTLALAVIASLREILGDGSLTVWGTLKPIQEGLLHLPSWLGGLHIPVMPSNPLVMMILPAGGFVMLGLLLALMNHLQAWQARRSGRALPPPLQLDCRHCAICKLD